MPPFDNLSSRSIEKTDLHFLLQAQSIMLNCAMSKTCHKMFCH